MWLASRWSVGGNLPFRLKSGKYVLGRSSHRDIVICDSSVSKMHARLFVTAQGVRIVDLGSRNGLEINGKLVLEALLLPGATVIVGAVPCFLAHEAKPAGREMDDDDSADCGQIRRKQPDLDLCLLTPTEQRVVELVAECLTGPQMAERLDISHGTLRNHVKSIHKKLGVHHRSELLLRLVRTEHEK